MLGPVWTEVVALLAAFAIAVAATPAGSQGRSFCCHFRSACLCTPSPAVTPTNLLSNVVATPGALYRYWRQKQTGGHLALVLIAGTLPGVIAGSVIRVERFGAARLRPGGRRRPGPAGYLAGADPAAVQGQGRASTSRARDRHAGAGDPGRCGGCVGGIYGIGGGSILAPDLIGSGLASRSRSSRLGLDVRDIGGGRGHVHDFVDSPAPPRGPRLADWSRPGNRRRLAGAYTGARLQKRMPYALIRRLVGILVIAIGARYLWAA